MTQGVPGWAAWPLAGLAGLAWWASQAPLEQPVGALLVTALWLAALDVDAASSRPRPALVGLVVGVVAFGPMLSWLALPATWLAVVALALVSGFWIAVASLVTAPWTRSPWVVVVAPVVWTAVEIARARVPLGGFGWGDLASGHASGSFLLDTARVVGADGLTLLSALFGALLFDLVRRVRTSEAEDPVGDRRDGVRDAIAGIDAARPAMLGLLGVGVAGLLLTVGPPPEVGRLDVLAVQGNDGTARGSAAEVDLAIARALADETIAAAAGDPPAVVVWPEYALDRDPFTERGADLAEQVDRAIEATGSTLMAGTRLDGDEPRTFRNQLTVFGPDGGVADEYVKRQIVPFGEYVPLRPLLGGFPPLAQQVAFDAVPGDGPAVVTAAGVDLAVAICFETLFGPLVRGAVDDVDAGAIVAVTNDASYGVSPASDQHVAQSQLRAVETGRWVVHAALSGRTTLIDPEGRVIEELGLFEVDSLRADLPLVSGRTPALVVAPVLAVVLPLVALGLAVAAIAGRREAARAG